jgi:ATP-dependent helicase YprA (DUF1998 family)
VNIDDAAIQPSQSREEKTEEEIKKHELNEKKEEINLTFGNNEISEFSVRMNDSCNEWSNRIQSKDFPYCASHQRKLNFIGCFGNAS